MSGLIINPFLFEVPYLTDAVVFDGTNDYMLKTGLTGLADGKKGIVSFWIKLNGGNGSILQIFGVTGAVFFQIRRNGSNILEIAGTTSGGSDILVLPTTSTYTSSSGWLHVLASWDLSLGLGTLYINNSSNLGSTLLTDANIDYTRSQYSIGAQVDASSKLNADLADFYLNLSQYLDFSNSANRALFINQSTLKPVDLGAAGATPTGTAPIIFQRCADGAAASTFATNLGTGGNFSITGSLTTAATSPSD